MVNLKLHSRDMTLFSLNEAEFSIFILNVSLLILLTFYNLLSLLVTLIFYFILERFMLRLFQIIITPSFIYELLQQSLLFQLAHLNLLIRLFLSNLENKFFSRSSVKIHTVNFNLNSNPVLKNHLKPHMPIIFSDFSVSSTLSKSSDAIVVKNPSFKSYLFKF